MEDVPALEKVNLTIGCSNSFKSNKQLSNWKTLVIVIKKSTYKNNETTPPDISGKIATMCQTVVNVVAKVHQESTQLLGKTQNSLQKSKVKEEKEGESAMKMAN